MRDGLFDPFRRRMDLQGALRPYLQQQPDPSLQPPVADFPMQTPGAAFRGEVARVRAPQQAPAIHPPAELNGQLQSGQPMPAMPPGSMPTAPIMEEPPVGGPSPYAMPPQPVQRGATPAGAPQEQMSADDLNRMVLALLQGSGGSTPQDELIRQQMAMGAPQQGAIY